MSCLYSSPESYAVALESYGVALASPRPARACAHRITMSSNFLAVQFHVVGFANHRVQQRRVPQPPAFTASRTKSFSLPKPAGSSSMTASRDGLLRKSSSAISGFRSLCGREQHSFSHCAQLDLRFGTFHSAGSRFENSGLTRNILRGQQPWTDVVGGT